MANDTANNEQKQDSKPYNLYGQLADVVVGDMQDGGKWLRGKLVRDGKKPVFFKAFGEKALKVIAAQDGEVVHLFGRFRSGSFEGRKGIVRTSTLMVLHADNERPKSRQAAETDKAEVAEAETAAA